MMKLCMHVTHHAESIRVGRLVKLGPAHRHHLRRMEQDRGGLELVEEALKLGVAIGA